MRICSKHQEPDPNCRLCREPYQQDSGSLERAGSVARGVIIELNLLRDWIKAGDGYNRDDAPDEIARAIANRIREIEARETTQPPNND